jgi:hypothetical protein
MSESLHAATPLDVPLDRSTAAAGGRGRLALRVAGAALMLGVLCDVLLRGDGFGINIPILVAALVTVAVVLVRQRDGSVPREVAGAGAAAIVFAAMFAWRDSEMLGVLNLLAIATSLAALALSSLRAPLANLLYGTVAEYVVAWVRSAADAIAGAIPLVARDVDLRAVAAPLRAGRLQRVAVGLLLALPLLVVFGALFSAADAVFGELVSSVVRIDVGLVVSHVLVTGVFAWIAGGWLRGVLLVRRDPALPGVPPALALGITEIGIALGLLDALFALFVGVQLRYLFGGDALVQATAGMTYAEYARSGFFEMCWASALVLPVLLSSRAALRVDRPRDARILRLLSLTLVGLVLVVMASALARLRLYVAAYGWTVDRLFAIAIVGWLATVFAWYVATALRGRVRGFAFGALASGALVLGQLNLFDPDAWVVERNRELVLSERLEIDAEYSWRSLSGDAVPAYLPTVPLLPADARCRAARTLLERWNVPDEDPRSWNLARARARDAVRRARPSLAAAAAAPECPAAQPAARPAGTAPAAPAPGM